MMIKYRVREVAKDLNIPNKDVLDTLAKYFPEMRRILAQTMGCDENQINLKATTEEGLGFTGREEGIAASAVCLLVEEDGR